MIELKIYDLAPALQALEAVRVKCDIPYKVARSLSQMKNVMREEVDHVRVAQQTLIENHKGAITDTGRVKFETAKECAEFEAVWKNMLLESVTLEIEPVDLSEYEEYISVSGSEVNLELLDNLILFGGGEPNG